MWTRPDLACTPSRQWGDRAVKAQLGAEDCVSITTMLVDGVVVTRAAGEIDAHSVDTVRAEVVQQLDQGPPSFVLDLSEVAFLASAGVHMLIEQSRLAQQRGAVFVVVADQRAVLHTLETTGVLGMFTVFPTVPAAIHALPARNAADHA